MITGKIIGIVASCATIGAFATAIYDKTQIDPNREQLNRLTKLIETQEEELRVQKRLLDILGGQQIARVEVDTGLPKNNNHTLLPPGTSTRNVTTTDIKSCFVKKATHEVIVDTLDVRESLPTLGSLAPKVGLLHKGGEYKMLDSERAGMFGLGTNWYKIEYCGYGNELAQGWVSSETDDGGQTSKAR